MNIFESIVSKIFKHQPAQAANQEQASSQIQVPNSPLANPQREASSINPQTHAVNVDEILSGMANEHAEKLNWKTSIVDLMKLLGLDSSLSARKELAKELNYTGDMNDTAKMNVWLSEQVMMKLAKNGGKVPADLH